MADSLLTAFRTDLPRQDPRMAFDISGGGRTVALHDGDERILSTLPRELGLRTPQCDRLWEAFYRTSLLTSTAEVARLRREIEAIRAAWDAERRTALAREKKVRARDPSTRDAILSALVSSDPLLAKCDDLIAL